MNENACELSRIARVECSTNIETAQIQWSRLMLNPLYFAALVKFVPLLP